MWVVVMRRQSCVQIDGRVGLTEGDADKAIAILTSNEEDSDG